MQGFQTKIAEVVTSDGRNVKLVSPITYIAKDGRIFVLPAGASTDGISSPPEVWSIRPPFGQDWLAGVLHDCLYRNTAQKPDGTLWQLPKDDCDHLLREAALSLGDTEEQADALFWGVVSFGWRSFENDR